MMATAEPRRLERRERRQRLVRPERREREQRPAALLKRQKSQSARGIVSAVMLGVGSLLLLMSLGGSPASLHPQLFSAIAIIALAVGLRVADGPSPSGTRKPG